MIAPANPATPARRRPPAASAGSPACSSPRPPAGRRAARATPGRCATGSRTSGRARPSTNPASSHPEVIPHLRQVVAEECCNGSTLRDPVRAAGDVVRRPKPSQSQRWPCFVNVTKSVRRRASRSPGSHRSDGATAARAGSRAGSSPTITTGSDRPRRPVEPVVRRGELGEQVRGEAVEGDVAEVEQAGPADRDVEPEREEDVEHRVQPRRGDVLVGGQHRDQRHDRSRTRARRATAGPRFSWSRSTRRERPAAHRRPSPARPTRRRRSAGLPRPASGRWRASARRSRQTFWSTGDAEDAARPEQHEDDQDGEDDQSWKAEER